MKSINNHTQMLPLRGAVLAASVLLTLGGGIAGAQGTPGAETILTPNVAIYQGSCADLNAKPAYQVGTAAVITSGSDATTTSAPLSTNPLLQVNHTVNAKLDDLTSASAPYALVVTADDPSGASLACGEIAGVVENGRLAVGLRPSNVPGLVGIAFLDRDDTGILNLGPQEVQVTAYLLPELVQMSTATPR